MKKLFLSLSFLIAFTTRALATDVTISSMTLDGVNPANIGSDRSIAVTASNGSPTVTSSGLFTAIVGLSGNRVLIDGSQYTVASVTSASTLTLTTNYAGTPGAQTMTLYKYVIMRVYADRAFQPLGSTQVVQPGTVGSGSFYRQFAASVVNNGSTNQLFIPQIIIPATTDALITNQAKYSFPFYSPAGAKLEFFLCPSSLAQLRLPPATPTTWTAICQFNSASAVVPPANDAYTKTQIDARLPSCSLNNGVYYSASGNILSCLTFGSGLTVVGSTLTATGGGTGYSTVQEEGGNLTQRGILNFIGTGITCADNAGATKTDCSIDPDLNSLASNATNGFWAAGTNVARTLTGTGNEITVTNGNGTVGNPVFSLPAALTFTGKTITGGTHSSPTINTPTIAGGTHTGITNFGIRSSGSGAFDLTLGNTENLTAGRTLTLTLNDASRTLNLGGNLTTGGVFSTTGTFSTAGNFSTGSTFATTGTFSSGGNFSTGSTFTTTPANALTFTTTGATNVTLPTSGTVAANGNNLSFFSSTTSAQLAGVISDETGSGALVFGTSPKIGTAILDVNGNELINLTATGSAVNEITLANAATGSYPAISASGNDSNVDITLTPKGTGKVGVGTPGGSPVAGIVGGPNASGSNIAGVSLDLHGGRGTGNAVPGTVALKYPLTTSSGSTVQSLSSTEYLPWVSMHIRNNGDITVSNTTTETSVLGASQNSSTSTLEAGLARAGRFFLVRLYGSVTTTGTPTLTVKLKLGSTTIANTGAVTMANNTSSGAAFVIEALVSVYTVGATGTVNVPSLKISYPTTNGGAINGFSAGAGSVGGTTTVDLTAAQTFDVTVQWGTANASNTVQVFTSIIDMSR